MQARVRRAGSERRRARGGRPRGTVLRTKANCLPVAVTEATAVTLSYTPGLLVAGQRTVLTGLQARSRATCKNATQVEE